MSVVKNLRSLSDMQFYKTAIDIRKSITLWLMRDFGSRRNPRSVKQVIKDITEEEQQTIDAIFEKYGKQSNRTYDCEYPEWFVNVERETITRILSGIVENITQANSIYARFDFEWNLRRQYQDKAISACYLLYQELQYIISVFNADINKFIPTLETIEREVQLLKGWRQSDNKKRELTTGKN